MFNKVLYTLFFLPLFMFASLTAEESTPDSESIKKIAHDFTEAWNKHDPKMMANFWAENGELLSPWAGMISGRAELEKHFAAEHTDKMKDSQIELTLDSIRFVDPDTAFVDGNLTITGMNIAGEQAVPFHNHGVFLFIKKDGAWKILVARPY
jgi:uncharacterized protein (TIGR02246 family)